MGFKMTIEVDVDNNPDAVGECLRSAFFDEKVINRHAEGHEEYREVGCYETFDWNDGVIPFPPTPVLVQSGEPDLMWTRAKLRRLIFGQIECRYVWDGDGTLAFHLPDGRWLVNTDCKKSYGWALVDSEEEIW